MRLIMYKRIASVQHESELIDLKEEMIDRFGSLPEALNNLFDIKKLKQKASALGIRKIDLGEKGGRIYFREHSNIDPKRILELIESNPKDYKFDGQDKLRINKKLTKKESRIEFLEYFFDEIVLKEAA
jgi:transcription-repair coupling factor (superfamily II helicase)